MKNFIKFIPNSLTIARIFMSFLFIYLILEKFFYGKDTFLALIMVFLIICFSDLMDGKIARKIGHASALGAKLDVFADLLYILLSYAVLIIIKILPLWFLCFICLKFLEFVLTSIFIKRNNKSSNNPFVFDRIGRLVSAVFFLIPGIVCTYECLVPYGTGGLMKCLLYVTLSAGVYSSYLRIKTCFTITALRSSSCMD